MFATKPNVRGERSNSTLWRWLRRIASLVFFAVVIFMSVRMSQYIEWGEVKTALRSFDIKTLAMSVAAAFGGYLVYSTFDLFGSRNTERHLPIPLVMTIGFVCYAFTLSLTTWVGGIAMRYRLYSRFGIEKGPIAKIFATSILMNWIGYFLLAGIVCMSGIVRTPDDWPIGINTVRAFGTLLLAPIIFFLWSCYRFPNQQRNVFGLQWQLPNLRTGVLQMALGAGNWMIMAAVIFILLQYRIDYATVLSTLLVSSVAAIIIHVPAGLGVIEAVFIALLQEALNRHQIMAAMVCYRAVYFLLPLLVAAGAYVGLEFNSASRRQAVP